MLSRLLDGGWVILLCALIATIIGVGFGALLGIVAAWRFGIRDELIMRSLDVILSFPPIILGLLLVSIVGAKLWLVVLAVALWHAPGSARVVRSVALEVRRRDFVQMAEALGVPTWRIMLGDIVPNVTSQILVEFGLRLTWSIGLIASLAFLGFGRQPPSADWGYMIYENLVGLTIQPWGVVAPIVADRAVDDRHQLRDRRHPAGRRRNRAGRRCRLGRRSNPRPNSPSGPTSRSWGCGSISAPPASTSWPRSPLPSGPAR